MTVAHADDIDVEGCGLNRGSLPGYDYLSYVLSTDAHSSHFTGQANTKYTQVQGTVNEHCVSTFFSTRVLKDQYAPVEHAKTTIFELETGILETRK